MERTRSSLLPVSATLALLVAGLPAGPATAQEGDLQSRIRESERRLEEIRAERDRLQREMAGLRTQAQSVSRELRNIERQLSTSRTVLAEIEFQADAAESQVRETTRDLVQTRERLREGKAVLNRRLRDIYKMGGLHTVRVLLGADSFADLLTRYRYLRLIAAYDRSLVDRVAELESELTLQSRELQSSLSELGRLRQTKLSEVAELRSVENARQRTLQEYRSREQRAQTRLEQLEEDAARMRDLVDDLERRRREAERRREVAGRRAEENTLSTGDAGTLDWPVRGRVIYDFGREQRPNGTVLRWNGIGIAAPPGEPVRAVRDGVVVLAGPFEGYGPTVVLSHGGGFYTLYLYLEEVGVVEGRPVSQGQVVGTVGGRDTPEGPHIEFQIRAPVNGGSPQAMDPRRWLGPPGGTP